MEQENGDSETNISIKPHVILWGEDFEPVSEKWLNISAEGRIISLMEEPLPDTRVILEPKGLLVPGLINAHTHVGDALFKDIGWNLSLKDLVAPPEGLKHKLLQEEPVDNLMRGMGHALLEMRNAGTTFFADFRENGMVGVGLLYIITQNMKFASLILGRPDKDRLGDWSEPGPYGFGLPSLNEYYQSFLGDIVEFSRDHGKVLGWHLAELERDATLLELTYQYQPDFIVHGTHLLPEDLRNLAERDIGVVMCPRSNFALGAGIPPLEEVIRGNSRAALGTDNAFVNSLDLFHELQFTNRVLRLNASGRDVPPEEILALVTSRAARCLGIEEDRGWLSDGKIADFFLVNLASSNLFCKDPDYVKLLVNRVKSENIYAVYQAGVKVFGK